MQRSEKGSMDRSKRGSAPRTGPWNLTVREPLVQGPILNLIRLELVTQVPSSRIGNFGTVRFHQRLVVRQKKSSGGAQPGVQDA